MPNCKLDITLESFPIFNSATTKWAWRYHVQNLGPDAIPSGTQIDITIGDPVAYTVQTLTHTSTVATIAAVGTTYNRYRITTTASIESGSSIPLDVLYNSKPETPPWTLKVSNLVFVTSGFTSYAFGGFYFFSFTGLNLGECIITAGLYAGSTSINVLCSGGSGIPILIYQGDVLVGTGTSNLTGISTITLTSPVIFGLAYIAYFGSKGNGTYGPAIAAESNKGLTGWKVADTIQGVNAESWTGDQVAAVYDPKDTINVGYGIENIATMFDKVPNFNLVITRSGANITVSVENISPWLGNARIQFDGGVINNVRTKTYPAVTTSQIRRVKVYHETNNIVYSEQTYTISNTLVSSTTQIWSASYEPNKVNNQTVNLLAYSKVPIEARIVQLAPSSGGGVGAWEAMTPSGGGAQKFSGPIYTNVPSGNYTTEYRVIGDTTILSIPISITWN